MNNRHSEKSDRKVVPLKKSLSNETLQKDPRDLDNSHVERITTDYVIFQISKNKKCCQVGIDISTIG